MAIEQKKSPLLEKEHIQIEPPDYTDEEITYLAGLRTRLESARNDRDVQHDEFDGMDYISYYNYNERLANTYIEPKRNKEDSNFQSGIIRTKLLALLNSIISLDLSGDISAFDKNQMKIQALGDAMEDIILKTDELDVDDEKQVLRQYELLKQGTVFVEEIWDEREKREKKMKSKFKGKLNVKWETRLKKAFARPSRNIIPGINVYLGDITKYSLSDQPYIFTVESMPYHEAELIFGKWERWKNVPKDKKPFDQANRTGTWQLLNIEQDSVEIVRYQDKWSNEFAVLINGVLMTPVGLPLPWGYEDYNITQQNLEPIHIKFAYGKSLVFKIRNKVAILDEMMKLAVLKTQKSFMPPYTNISGRIISNRVLMPGKISHGIPPNTLVPINEREAMGVSQAELAMINEMQRSIDIETTSPVFSGQQTQGQTTATEIIEMQRQAKQMLGLVIFAATMLEWKLEWLRLQNILANWFNPIDEVVDEARGVIKEKYRVISVNRPIEGEGRGTRMIIPTKEIPSSEAIMRAEDIYSKKIGEPVRFVFLNPEEVTNSKICWQIVIRPREKRTSETEKLMFRAEMADAQLFGEALNMEYLQEKFASIWNEDPKKMFKSPEQTEEQLEEQLEEQPIEGAPIQGISLKGAPVPTVEGGAISQEIKTRV